MTDATIRVYWPLFRSEAHRRFERPDRTQAHRVVEELRELGVECCPGRVVPSEAPGADDLEIPVEGKRYDLAFFAGSHLASAWQMPPCERLLPGVPRVWYCWDLYPGHVERARREIPHDAGIFDTVIDCGSRCDLIVVPSGCARRNVQQLVGKDAVVVRSPAHPIDAVPVDGGFVLDAMRKYPDPFERAVRDACLRLKIPCVETMCAVGWDEYVERLRSCRLLVSAYRQASTGGLSLLEAHALGKPVLINASPENGARDYLGDRPGVEYFTDQADLERRLRRMYRDPPRLDATECRRWVEETFSDRRFARDLAECFKGVVRDRAGNR